MRHHLVLHIIASAQKNGGLAAFIDAEHALDPGYARKIPLSELDTLSVVKAGSKPGSSGLLYRLTTAGTTVDVPYFARRELTPDHHLVLP